MNNSFARIKELSPEQRDLLLRRLARVDPKGGEGVAKLVRRSRDSDEEAPLSFAQERQWFLDRLAPGDPAYIITGALRLIGTLSLPALHVAFDEIIRRHEMLRANFFVRDGHPAQRINPPSPFPIDIVDLTGLDTAQREAECRRRYGEEASIGFDLARDRLLRARLIRLADHEHFLIFSKHHIVSDGWSIGVLLEEIGRLYTAFVRSGEADLPDLPISYGDFARWQRQRVQGNTLEEGLSYWRRKLENPPPVLELPPDRILHSASSAERDLVGATCDRLVGPGLKLQLDRLSRQEDTTAFVTLLAGFMTLLMRCTGREDILIGSPVNGRIRLETENLVGLFLNTLALRARLSPELSFRQAIALVRNCVLDGLAHHEVPFERVVRDIDPDRSAKSHPLFEMFFNFTPSPPRLLELPGLRASFEAPVAVRSEFAMTLYVTEWEGSLELKLLYQRDRYSEARMSMFLEQFEAILREAVIDPDRLLGSFDLAAPQRGIVLPDPAVELEQPEQLSVPSAIAAWARRTPDAPAIVQGDAALSYRQLYARMVELAGHLRQKGLAAGGVVAVRGPRCPGLIVGMAGVLLAGGTLLTISPDLPERRQRLMLREAGACVLLQPDTQPVEHDWRDDMPDLALLTIDARSGAIDGIAADIDGSPSSADAARPAPHTPAYIFFTSGTTGTPKAILGSHAGLAHFLAWQRQEFAIGPADRCGQLTGISFDVVLRDIFLPLTSGARLVLPPQAVAMSSADLLRWLQDQHISMLHTVPSLAEAWLMNPTDGISLDALRHVFFAGEPLTAALVERWRSAFPSPAEIINLYGPTETTLAKCFYRVPAQPRAGVQSLGRPLPQTQMLVLTPARTMCGVGEPGEIAVRTPFRSFGYLNAPDNNARSFAANPFGGTAEDRIYLTGDRGVYRADGTLEFLGRFDDQLKVRGVRVEPMEVAATLQSCADVSTCAVLVRHDDRGEPALIAYVVPKPGVSPNVKRLREFLHQRLPPQMLPSHFVFLNELPLTANQKLDRERLPPPGEKCDDPERRYVAPRDAIELRLTQIWEELLHARVGVTDNFFELGGHSLLALRLLVNIEQNLGKKVPVAALFENPTIEGLAAHLGRQPAESQQIVKMWSAEHRLKFFLVHTGGGTVLNYVPLVRSLAANVSVFGIQARALDGDGDPHRDIAEMAADYVEKLRQLQPAGPYLLGGHSLGGVIVYEMARQLSEAGHQVALQAMFDSTLARPSDHALAGDLSRDTDTRDLAAAAKTIARFMGKQLALSLQDIRDLPLDNQITHVLTHLERADALPFGDAYKMMCNLLNVSRAHVEARRSYHPAPSAVPVTLFRVHDAGPADDSSADGDAIFRDSLGWSAVSSRPVRVFRVPGDHVTMMNEPHVGVLAESLRSCLSEAIAASGD
ncbi:amino acid adenylation domain-containing protein [Bradyrhizobium ontarionense]|uniref:Amino acid adenylation domain-containing protein n=1 Tax=Bradyrhizobium ontarionense TaxID=2898149 RepID=A0ABY3RLA4_9BRAD|nr:non-ribosomal peptide synthetase [Bradyrhizobium sp. A19]UFZ08166.1 amino acid adenylation domain-containing protein [Bradyrhizobium sp. A19]